MVGVQDHGSSTLNVSGTGEQIGTPLTQVGSRAVRFEIIDREGCTLGPFSSLAEANGVASALLGDQEAGDWDVQVVR